MGKGYGESKFSYVCPACSGEITHDLLQVYQFRKDTQQLLLNDFPLKGTIFHGTDGLLTKVPVTQEGNYSGTFPNRLIALGLRTEILQLIDGNAYNRPSMTSVRDLIQLAMSSHKILSLVNGKLTLGKAEKLSIRKMMSRYWNNHSIFAMELGGAVIRQGTFVDKMVKIDWLHSPTLSTTMTRLLSKYDRFMKIIGAHPYNTAVPTLDVDLAWHTHQLMPKQYFGYTVKLTRKFIDHDDKIEENKLSTAFEWTSRTYEKMFNEVYSECTCWYCEGKFPNHTWKPIY